MSITTKYDPEQVIGEFGWLWMETPTGEEWVLVRTVEGGEEEEGEIMADTYDLSSPESDGWDYASNLKGAPYLPIHKPTCEPGDALEVKMLIESGACLSFVERTEGGGEETQRRVMAALMSGREPQPARRG